MLRCMSKCIQPWHVVQRRFTNSINAIARLHHHQQEQHSACMHGCVHICYSISHIFVHVSVAGVCIPYSQQACRDAALALGLSVPTKGFSGSFKHKGCYAYSSGTNKGKAFYGTGGSRNEMQKQLPDDRYRPTNYDCAAGNYVSYRYVGMHVRMYMCIYVCVSVCSHAYVYR